MVAVIGQKVRGGSYSRCDAGRVLKRFRGDIRRGAFRYIVVDNGLVHAAMTLVEEVDVALRTADSLHLAAILRYRCDLITGDARMAGAAKQLGITTSYVPGTLSTLGVSAIDAVIKTLKLDSVLDHRRWSNPHSRERKELMFIRASRTEHQQLWCHVPSGAVVRVRLKAGQYHGKVLK